MFNINIQLTQDLITQIVISNSYNCSNSFVVVNNEADENCYRTKVYNILLVVIVHHKIFLQNHRIRRIDYKLVQLNGSLYKNKHDQLIYEPHKVPRVLITRLRIRTCAPKVSVQRYGTCLERFVNLSHRANAFEFQQDFIGPLNGCRGRISDKVARSVVVGIYYIGLSPFVLERHTRAKLLDTLINRCNFSND